jgi:hypothetical protein
MNYGRIYLPKMPPYSDKGKCDDKWFDVLLDTASGANLDILGK